MDILKEKLVSFVRTYTSQTSAVLNLDPKSEAILKPIIEAAVFSGIGVAASIVTGRHQGSPVTPEQLYQTVDEAAEVFGFGASKLQF